MFEKFFIYPLARVHYNPSLNFYYPLKNNSQSYAQTKITHQRLLTGKRNSRMCNSFYFTGKRQRTISKMEGKHVIENLFLSFVIIAREHVDTQDTLARENVSTQGT